jgi:hypothetical protein
VRIDDGGAVPGRIVDAKSGVVDHLQQRFDQEAVHWVTRGPGDGLVEAPVRFEEYVAVVHSFAHRLDRVADLLELLVGHPLGGQPGE